MRERYSVADDDVDLLRPVREYTPADLERLLRRTECALADFERKIAILQAIKAGVESELAAHRRGTPPARG